MVPMAFEHDAGGTKVVDLSADGLQADGYGLVLIDVILSVIDLHKAGFNISGFRKIIVDIIIFSDTGQQVGTGVEHVFDPVDGNGLAGAGLQGDGVKIEPMAVVLYPTGDSGAGSGVEIVALAVCLHQSCLHQAAVPKEVDVAVDAHEPCGKKSAIFHKIFLPVLDKEAGILPPKLHNIAGEGLSVAVGDDASKIFTNVVSLQCLSCPGFGGAEGAPFLAVVRPLPAEGHIRSAGLDVEGHFLAHGCGNILGLRGDLQRLTHVQGDLFGLCLIAGGISDDTVYLPPGAGLVHGYGVCV